MNEIIGFGGGCHWCTEAIFQSIPKVDKVEQGWIKSNPPNDQFSEAVLVHFDEEKISCDYLIATHIKTHSATSNHSLRPKYRSAIYTFNDDQMKNCQVIIGKLQNENKGTIITKILPFHDFKLNEETYLNYYLNNPEKPFCKTYIQPKLEKLKDDLNYI